MGVVESRHWSPGFSFLQLPGTSLLPLKRWTNTLLPWVHPDLDLNLFLSPLPSAAYFMSSIFPMCRGASSLKLTQIPQKSSLYFLPFHPPSPTTSMLSAISVGSAGNSGEGSCVKEGEDEEWVRYGVGSWKVFKGKCLHGSHNWREKRSNEQHKPSAGKGDGKSL